MTRLDKLTAAIFAAAACLLAAAAFLTFLATRGMPLSFGASVAVAGLVALVFPAVTASVAGRLTAWRGVGPWCASFAICGVAVAAVFGLLSL